MSIPPLVCSTPPPPDQCEDDKDPEDFDLSYNLSQEEEDDENDDYNYGNFSSYETFQAASDDKPLGIKDQEMTRSLDSDEHKVLFIQYDIKETEQGNAEVEAYGTNHIDENKLKCEEDINIEDLNLKLDEEIVTNIADNSDENESSDQNTDSLKDLNIPCHSNNSSQDEDNTNVSSFENVIDIEHTTGAEVSHVDLEESIVEQSGIVLTKLETIADELEKKDVQSPIESNEPSRIEETSENSEDFPEVFQQSKPFEVLSNENVIDDDFGDFDDFQFVNTKNNVTSVVDSSNPWENTDTNQSDFGNFTANFEENKFHTQDSPPLEIHAVSNDQQLENQVINEESNLDDDEFGDFDDFKSSNVNTEFNEVLEECHELPVLNLQSTDNEHHIMESITKVLTAVFIEEISEPDTEFEGKLESLLSETWGHLMETDERQPYIVNWNNSLGQKTLLKALCIDSRNILFGPKWSSHMPKYAANLTNAPLQPQKQSTTTSNVSQSEIVAETTSSKPTTWSDPFTSDGQEFTYAEALLLDLEHLMATLDQMAHNHSTLKISELLSHACNTETESSTVTPRPTDLDVFEAAISNKSEKIYSSALGVQPIRQINLPDTHIFTPTDSEIPRSKTIHYDQTPTVLLPQPVGADNQIPVDNTVIQNKNSVTNTEHDTEYWEFQDFKSMSDSKPCSVSQVQIPQEKNFEITTTNSALPKPNIAYQTQLLQPIKVEPSMPTLNWPDPGEIKGPYDDFSDFVSISSQSTDKQNSSIIQAPNSQLETNNIIRSNNMNDLNEKTEVVSTESVKPDNKGFDDEFDTFKSALPSKSDLKSNTFGSTSNQMPSGRFTDFDYTSLKNNSIKSDTISFATLPRPSEALTQNLGHVSNTTELTNKSLSSGTQIQSSLLQPAPASFSAVNTQNQRTTGQILQPLSLESYSQINWPSPGIDLQDLSRFNPVETLQSLKSDLSVGGLSKSGSPVHTQKTTIVNQSADDDVWGEFVSSKPKQQQSMLKKPGVFAEDDEWTDFISSPSVKPPNGLNTISFNVHTNSHIQKTVQNKFAMKNNQAPVDIPTLNYITPKTNSHKSYNDKHFQNL